MKSLTSKALDVLSDLKPHHSKEMNEKIGWRFADKIHRLRGLGCDIITEMDGKYAIYTLKKVPENMKNRNNFFHLNGIKARNAFKQIQEFGWECKKIESKGIDIYEVQKKISLLNKLTFGLLG